MVSAADDPPPGIGLLGLERGTPLNARGGQGVVVGQIPAANSNPEQGSASPATQSVGDGRGIGTT